MTGAVFADPGSGRSLRVRAPGRANLIGEHTDHTDGLVLPVAIDRVVHLDAVPGGDRIVLTSQQVAGRVDLAADGSETPTRGWGRFVAAVAAELAGIGRAPVGLTGHLASDLPQGVGLSSSAALEVALATALCDVAELQLPPLELAALCRRAEHRAVGVPSGILDQAASVLGRAGQAVLLDCGSLAYRYVPVPADHDVLIVDSGVRRKLESSGYAQRSEELRAALWVLDGRRPADVAADELERLLAPLAEVPARRLRHVVTENERVRRAEVALTEGRLAEIGELFAASHASLRDDYEVTVPEVDALVELACEHGAAGARMTGGGFGGSIVALVPVGRTEQVREAVLDVYASRFPERRGIGFACRAAEGAGVVSRIP